MNTTSQNQAFNMPAFKKNLLVTVNTLMDYITQDDIDDWNTEFLPGTLKSFVTSEYFLNLSNNDRKDMIQLWRTVSYILELLENLFTDDVRENNVEIYKHLRALLDCDKSA